MDQPNQLQRFCWNLIPDVTAVTSFKKGAQVYGLSWPVWDRIYVTAGLRVTRHRLVKSGYHAGDEISSDLTRDDISRIEHNVTTILGFSVDLFRTR